MKFGFLATLVALIGSAACSTDSTPSGGHDAGSDTGSGSGGKSGTGGTAPVTGGAGGSVEVEAGPGGAGGRAPTPEAGTDASADGGSPGTPEAGADTGTEGGALGENCTNFRCFPQYFEVQFPPQNPFSDDKAMLGKFLFWDEQMGELDSMACGTCHRSGAGGSDPRTNDLDKKGVAIAHLPGPDNMLDTAPGLTSDDIRGAAGVLACTDAKTVTGTAPQVTTRKPPSYFDAMFAPRVFWDGRAGDCKPGDGSNGGCFYDPDTLLQPGSTGKPLIAGTYDTTTQRIIGGALEQQSMGPPVNSHEMACSDQSWAKIEAKLATVTPLAKAKPGSVPQDMKDFAAKYQTYPRMFAQAFGTAAKLSDAQPDNVINSQRIAFAIATHERRLTSNQTRWDRWIAGDDNPATSLTAQQLRGYLVFMGPARCAFCHVPPLFTDFTFRNIGFHKPAWDAGRKAITGLDGDIAKFKTPTLRNVGLREPFGLLHEGEGPGHDLEAVMALYKQGGQRSDAEIGPFIDPSLQAVPLNQADIADIIEFLRNGLTDPRVKAETAPFDRPHVSTE
jgi:cytochrome c peroxidase